MTSAKARDTERQQPREGDRLEGRGEEHSAEDREERALEHAMSLEHRVTHDGTPCRRERVRAAFGPSRLPTGCRRARRCLGRPEPFRSALEERTDLREPQPGIELVLLPRAVRPLGRRSACHDLHGRTVPYFCSAGLRAVNRALTCTDARCRRSGSPCRTRRNLENSGRCPACRAAPRRQTCLVSSPGGSRSRSRARSWCGWTRSRRCGSGPAGPPSRRARWCAP